jgi:hypothetical protein
LTTGRSKSCGCWRKEKLAAGIGKTHGLSDTTIYNLWQGAKRRAKAQGVAFDLKLEDIVIPKICPALGIEIVPHRGKGASPHSPTIDRIIPSLGYVRRNIEVISHRANAIKNNASIEELGQVLGHVRMITRLRGLR